MEDSEGRGVTMTAARTLALLVRLMGRPGTAECGRHRDAGLSLQTITLADGRWIWKVTATVQGPAPLMGLLGFGGESAGLASGVKVGLGETEPPGPSLAMGPSGRDPSSSYPPAHGLLPLTPCGEHTLGPSSLEQFFLQKSLQGAD